MGRSFTVRGRRITPKPINPPEPLESRVVLSPIGAGTPDRSRRAAAAVRPLQAAPEAGSGTFLGGQFASVPSAEFPTIQLAPGYRIERVASGLTYATAMTFDEQGRLYVAEAGGQFLEEPPASRILRIEGGRAVEVANLTALGVADSVAGLAYRGGSFYFTHRDPADRTGAVSRLNPDGTLTRLLSGIVDSQSEHQVNGLRFGPDGRLYVTSGPAFNSGVAGIDNAPFIQRSPGVRTTAGQDLVLTGVNFETPDFRTPDPSDTVQTGAYVPFGTATAPGQVIRGTNKPGGAILAFDPDNAEATVRPFAWGFRNVIGIAFDGAGQLYAAVNGYDVRGSRPINDRYDVTYRVREGAWYGYPDYSAALEPVTDPRFDSPDSLQAMQFVNGVPVGRALRPVIDQAASGLATPDRTLVYGRHEVNSSPSLIDIAPASFGPVGGQVFVAEWGDLAPNTTPLRDGNAGFQIVRIDPETGRAVPFVRNLSRGPASAQGAEGLGIERPYDVQFGPDGAMYIVDYGIARVNRGREAEGQVPYEFPPGTAAIWRVTRDPLAGPTVQALRTDTGRGGADLVVTFSDEVTNLTAANFAVRTPGRDGRFGTSDDRTTPVRSVSFLPGQRTARVSLGRGFRPGQLQQLVLRPEGGPAGVALDGDANGRPGGSFAATFGVGSDLRFTDVDGDRVTLRLRGGGRLETLGGADGAVQQVRVVGARSGRTVLSGEVRRARSGGDGRVDLPAVLGLDGVRNRLTSPTFTIGFPDPAAVDAALASGVVATRTRPDGPRDNWLRP